MKRRGVARILEAVFSAVLIIEAVAIGYMLLKTPNPGTTKSTEELYKFGYSMLSSLCANNGLDRLIFDSNWNIRRGWEGDLKVVMNSLVPPNVVFNISIYNATYDEEGFIKLVRLNRVPISNVVDEEAFIKAGENILITYIYTTYNPVKDDIVILFIYLRLATLRGV